ncbi:hypothetical protein A3Q56_05902 [Intoshia linei]|uniref:Uncharacterized protein n=1 Tax=Intoshia linei TaxID=1819745 RepID=A0A177AWL1_9BILA|nr:hypothetical protein A3Q56_05902 [Intoshia linei]
MKEKYSQNNPILSKLLRERENSKLLAKRRNQSIYFSADFLSNPLSSNTIPDIKEDIEMNSFHTGVEDMKNPVVKLNDMDYNTQYIGLMDSRNRFHTKINNSCAYSTMTNFPTENGKNENSNELLPINNHVYSKMLRNIMPDKKYHQVSESTHGTQDSNNKKVLMNNILINENALKSLKMAESEISNKFRDSYPTFSNSADFMENYTASSNEYGNFNNMTHEQQMNIMYQKMIKNAQEKKIIDNYFQVYSKCPIDCTKKIPTYQQKNKNTEQYQNCFRRSYDQYHIKTLIDKYAEIPKLATRPKSDITSKAPINCGTHVEQFNRNIIIQCSYCNTPLSIERIRQLENNLKFPTCSNCFKFIINKKY